MQEFGKRKVRLTFAPRILTTHGLAQVSISRRIIQVDLTPETRLGQRRTGQKGNRATLLTSSLS